jgi:peptidoglycan L-alanyl-D-glutamate endopeptidase CwlK
VNNFRLSQRSRGHLNGVHPDLVRVVERAIELTDIDFGITEGLRTAARQKQLVASGASKTMNSRHLTGHAVDVVAYLGYVVRWGWGLYVQIAEAVQKAAQELNIPVVWGGCWMVVNRVPNLDAAVAQYAERKRREGGRPLLDGPHFELWREVYQ